MTTNIVFMGSPEFAIPSLINLAEIFTVIGVVTQPDRKAGRGRQLSAPPVKEKALQLGLEVYQPASLRTPEAFEKLESWAPDLIVVAAFGQILKKNVLDLPPHGCINVHASLLPRWRGASPINAAILHGDKESGVTIMKMNEGLDTGPILAARSMPIPENMNAGQLSDSLAKMGGELLTDILADYLAGKLTLQTQDESQATYAPMLSKQDGLLDFSQPAEVVTRKVRAFYPWPGTFTYWKDQPLKIHRTAAVTGSSQTGKPGHRLIHHGKPAFFTSDGILILEEVQPAGKRKMEADTFLNGARDWDHN
jgi:methionyl-tRNA formyltransferase